MSECFSIEFTGLNFLLVINLILEERTFTDIFKLFYFLVIATPQSVIYSGAYINTVARETVQQDYLET